MRRVLAAFLIVACVITLTPTSAIASSIDYRVNASSDDCIRSLRTNSFFALDNGSCIVGRNTVEDAKWGTGLRFQSVVVPQGVTIIEAHISLRARDPGDYSNSGEGVSTRISALDADDAPAFSTASDFDTKYGERTGHRVNWTDIEAWTTGEWYDSPDIKKVVQEVVDREGWRSGNSMIIFWEDFDNRSEANDARRFACSYDDKAAYAPRLHIEYEDSNPPAGDFDALTSEVGRLSSKVDELSTQVSEMSSAIKEVGGSSGLHSKEISTLEGKVDALKKEIEALSTSIANLDEVPGLLTLETKLKYLAGLTIMALAGIIFLCFRR